MTIRFQCPQCNSPKSVADEHAGKTGKCKCGASFKIPALQEPEPEAILDLSAHSQPDHSDPFSFGELAPETQSAGLFQDFSNLPPNQPSSSYPSNGTSSGMFPGAVPNGPAAPAKKPAKSVPSKQTKSDPKKVEEETTVFAVAGAEIGVGVSGFITAGYAVAYDMRGLLIMAIIIAVVSVVMLKYSQFRDDAGITELIGGKEILKKHNPVAVILYHDKWASAKQTLAFVIWLVIFSIVPAVSIIGLFNLMGDTKITTEELAQETPPAAVPMETLDEKLIREQAELAAGKEELKLTHEEMLILVEKSADDLLTPDVIERRRTVVDEPKVSIQQWTNCADDSVANKNVEAYVQLFGDLRQRPPASPTLRYVLFEDKLCDLETKTYRTFSGRRHHIASKNRGFTQKPLEISEDGTLVLVQAQSEEPQGSFQNMILLHEADNSLVRAFPDATEAYFLPGNKILLKDVNEGFTFISGTNFDQKSPYLKRDLLAMSPTRKYIAFGGGKRLILEENPVGPSGQVTHTPFDLTIYSSESFAPIADATYENFGYFRQAFFSNDGKKLLVANTKSCAAVALSDGKVSGRTHPLGADETCLGWVGDGSNGVAISTQFRNGNFPLSRYIDIESGNRLLRTDDQSDLPTIDYFGNAYIYSSQKRDKWFPIPRAEIDSALKNYELGEPKPVPRKVKLNIQSGWKQPEAMLGLMKHVATKQLGLEVIDQQDSSEHFELTLVMNTVASKTIGVEFRAVHQDGSFIWSATGVSDKKAEISDDPYQQERVVETVLAAMVSAINKLMLNHRLPENYREGFVPQTNEGQMELKGPIEPSRQGLTAFAATDTQKIDNSWLVSNAFFNRPPPPVLDFEVPESSRVSDGETLKVIGFIEEDAEPQVVMSYPGVGVFAVGLTPAAQATKFKDFGEFTQAVLNPETKEVLLMKEDSILFKPLSSAKRSRSLKLESAPKAIAVNPDGTVLAVATDRQIQFFDLKLFASKPRDPNLKTCEADFELAGGELRFSANGTWFCATSGSESRRAIVVDVANKSSLLFEVDKEIHKSFVNDEGELSCRGMKGHLFVWKRSAPGELAKAIPVRGKDLLDTPIDGAISPKGDRYVYIDRDGNVREMPYPDCKPIEKQFDPGHEFEESLEGSRLDWSSTGSYYYLLQRDRIVVWKANGVSEN